MKARSLVLFSLFLVIAHLVQAGYGAGNPRLERLYATFISPCCWRENLTVHNSQIADELRAQIVVMVQAGRSDGEIKSALIAKYGKRILALPEGSQQLWLVLPPLLAGAAGLICVLLLLRRSRFRANVPAWPDLPPAELDENWDAN
jgi:cytochrome c-type biogenesis protein CcmH/NrfF